MVLRGRINRGADQRERKLFARFHIVRAAADLKCAMFPGVYRCDMQMGVRDALARFHQPDNHTADLLSRLMQLFYLESARKQLLLKLLRRHIDLYIFLQPA